MLPIRNSVSGIASHAKFDLPNSFLLFSLLLLWTYLFSSNRLCPMIFRNSTLKVILLAIAFLIGIAVASKEPPPKLLCETYCWKSQYLNPGETVCCNNPSVSFESAYLGAAVAWSSYWTLWYDCGCMGSQVLFGTVAGDYCNTPYTNVNCTVCVTNTNQLWTHEWDIQASGPCTRDTFMKDNVKDGTATNRIKISQESVVKPPPKAESTIPMEVILSFISINTSNHFFIFNLH